MTYGSATGLQSEGIITHLSSTQDEVLFSPVTVLREQLEQLGNLQKEEKTVRMEANTVKGR